LFSELCQKHPPLSLIGPELLHAKASDEMLRYWVRRNVYSVRVLRCRFKKPAFLQKIGALSRGAELDPLYIDVVVRRYEATTGNPAVLIETGETLEALAARRALEDVPV
jgi:hypothetical protein